MTVPIAAAPVRAHSNTGAGRIAAALDGGALTDSGNAGSEKVDGKRRSGGEGSATSDAGSAPSRGGGMSSMTFQSLPSAEALRGVRQVRVPLASTMAGHSPSTSEDGRVG